jgi:hypothetical protein
VSVGDDVFERLAERFDLRGALGLSARQQAGVAGGLAEPEQGLEGCEDVRARRVRRS